MPIFRVSQVRLLVILAVDLVNDRAGVPGHIDIEVLAFPFANELGPHLFIVRIEQLLIATMQGDVKNLVVIIKVLLRAVAVVDVPIEDAHPLALRPCKSGCNRDVVEHTEACHFMALGMMSRWPGDAVSALEWSTLVQNGFHTFHCCQGRDQGSLIALLAKIEVLLSLWQRLGGPDGLALLLHAVDVLLRMVQGKNFILKPFDNRIIEGTNLDFVHVIEQLILFQVGVDVAHPVGHLWAVVGLLGVCFVAVVHVHRRHSLIENVECFVMLILSTPPGLGQDSKKRLAYRSPSSPRA